jgi:hypothetical protein
MKHMKMRVALAAVLCLAVSSLAVAQTPAPQRIFVDVNGGGQTQSRSIQTSASFPLYGETAHINTAQGIDGGGLFDIRAGYFVLPQIGVSIGVSTFSDKASGTAAASIPSPILVNRPSTVTASVDGLKHKETATHLAVSYFNRLPYKVEAEVFLGLSIYNVTQESMTATIPTGSQTLAVASQSEKASASGVNIGFNLNYMYRPNYGAGVFLRYAGASPDFETVGELKVGGTQLGIGARLRF